MSFSGSPPWGPVKGPSPRLLMITIIKSRDAMDVCYRSREELANDVGVKPDTITLTAAKLEQWKMIRQEDSSRSYWGTFAGKCYHLRTDRADVRALIAYYDPRGEANELGTESRPNGPSGIFETEPKNPRGKSPSPREEIRCPSQEIGCGTYKESRASAGASKIIYHSLPDDHEIEDEELIDQIKLVLAVCGEGTAGVPTHRLVDSLAFHIPRALAEGYDLKQDIRACIRLYTQNPRKEPLNRFDVTFRDDLPKWRRERLRRQAAKDFSAVKATSQRNVGGTQRAPKAAEDLRSPPATIDGTKLRPRIEGLLAQLAIIDSGQDPDFILDDKDEKRLGGERRKEAFRRARTRIVNDLAGLGVSVPDVNSRTPEQLDAPHDIGGEAQ